MVNTRVIDDYNVAAYGAIGDGSPHPLSERFSTLTAAQVVYPSATALTEQIDRHAVQRAIDVATANPRGGKVVLGPRWFVTDATVVGKSNVSIVGIRGVTQFRTTATTFDGVRINTGINLDSNVEVSGFAVRGPTGGVTSGTTAAIKIDQSTNLECRDLEGHQYPIGLDLVNNNYNTSFYNFMVPRFASCALGINIRRGADSGSDLYFFNTQLNAYQCCVCLDGGGGGYYFYGFQFGNVNTVSSDATGVIMLAYDWIAQAITSSGSLAQTLFCGGSIEGPHYNWMIRGYSRSFVTFQNVSFQATATDATRMLGFMKFTTMSNSRISFVDCEVRGHYAQQNIIQISGQQGNVIYERDTRIPYEANALVTNAGGVQSVYSGFGDFLGMCWQSGITACRVETYNAIMLSGRWLTESTYGFSWADNVSGPWVEVSARAAVRNVTAAGNVTVTAADMVVGVNKSSGAATQVDLPAGTDGMRFWIKDAKGDAATNNITIVPAAGNIDGSANYVINTNYGSVALAYFGGKWNVVGKT